MSIQTRARSDDSKSPDPEKVLHRASYGLFSRRSGAKNLGFPTGGEGFAL